MELMSLAPWPHTQHSPHTYCHSPQEPVVPQPIGFPADPRPRPQEARQLPLQHHRGGHHLEGGQKAVRVREHWRPPTEGTKRSLWDDDSRDEWRWRPLPIPCARHHAACLPHHSPKRRENVLRVLNETVTLTLLFRFMENESFQTNLICFFIRKATDQ